VDSDNRSLLVVGPGVAVNRTYPITPSGHDAWGGGETNMLSNLMSFVQSLTERLSLRDESGQALVEYGLLVGLIAAVCVLVITTLGTDISSFFQSIATAL
jgi:pilus assembly protein Flp/PilA